LANKIAINKWLRWSYGLFLGITFNFLLDVIYGLIYSQYLLFQPLQKYVSSVIITYIVFECIFLFNRFLEKKLSWENKTITRYFVQNGSSAIIAILLTYGIRFIINWLISPIQYVSLFDELIFTGYVLFITFCITSVELVMFMLNKWRFSLGELERFKKENAEFRFESLRSQLNPHFLFNSLNTLSSLVYENQDKAGIFIRELSDVYRYILENRDKDIIQLSDELEFARSYIQLVQLRFDKNLNIEIIDNNKSERLLSIAPLSLQLLLENAIKHNIISRKYPLHIKIIISDQTIEVSNKLQPKEIKEFSSELGLKNIKSRYKFLTERNVEIIESEDEFIVRIPLIS
jgi:two-component system, LytTR family, sensor kinase